MGEGRRSGTPREHVGARGGFDGGGDVEVRGRSEVDGRSQVEAQVDVRVEVEQAHDLLAWQGGGAFGGQVSGCQRVAHGDLLDGRGR
jgi:hypothetical protein